MNGPSRPPGNPPQQAPSRAGDVAIGNAAHGLRCLRCARIQPPLPRGVRTCVYCSASLPVRRWRADPPLTVAVRKSAGPAGRRPYFGPPSYRGDHPRWGFPPVVWRAAEVVGNPRPSIRTGAIRAAEYLCLLTFIAALAAAGGETWRYLLLLRGRTEVLSGPVVASSDRVVAVAALLAAVSAVATAAVVVPTLVRLHAVAADRAGLEPSRPPASVLARLVVPGWNVHGLGVVATEIDGLLTGSAPGARPRLSRLVLCWWCCWAVDSVLVLVTLIKAFGSTEQALADTVELHIFVDATGALVALLGAFVLRRFRRLLVGNRRGHRANWVVRPPAPTRGVRPDEPAPDQPAMVTTAPGSKDDAPDTNQTTVPAGSSGDRPTAEPPWRPMPPVP